MTGKIYCERCDSIFESRAKFERHMESAHTAGMGCEACVIDTAISKIMKFFRK